MVKVEDCRLGGRQATSIAIAKASHPDTPEGTWRTAECQECGLLVQAMIEGNRKFQTYNFEKPCPVQGNGEASN